MKVDSVCSVERNENQQNYRKDGISGHEVELSETGGKMSTSGAAMRPGAIAEVDSLDGLKWLRLRRLLRLARRVNEIGETKFFTTLLGVAHLMSQLELPQYHVLLKIRLIKVT